MGNNPFWSQGGLSDGGSPNGNWVLNDNSDGVYTSVHVSRPLVLNENNVQVGSQAKWNGNMRYGLDGLYYTKPKARVFQGPNHDAKVRLFFSGRILDSCVGIFDVLRFDYSIEESYIPTSTRLRLKLYGDKCQK